MSGASAKAESVPTDAHGVTRAPLLEAGDGFRILVWLALSSLVLFAAVAWIRIEATDSFDRPFSLAINQVARRLPALDHMLSALDEFALFQGVPLIALACGAFVSTQSGAERVVLVIGCAGAALAAVLSRGLQLFLPHLPRPLFDPALPIQAPYGADLVLKDWSSFPSDHAALLWGVAAATLLINRSMGALAIGICLVASFARIYGGQHYLSDILGGGLLALGMVCTSVAITQRWAAPIARLAAPRRAVLAILGFIAACQAAYLFDDIRAVARETAHQIAEIRARR